MSAVANSDNSTILLIPQLQEPRTIDFFNVDYELIEVTRLPLTFGLPVEWNVILSDRYRNYTVGYTTPAISVTESDVTVGSTFNRYITFSTEYSETYTDISYTTFVPQVSNITLLPDIGYNYALPGYVTFVLDELNSNKTIQVQGIVNNAAAFNVTPQNDTVENISITLPVNVSINQTVNQTINQTINQTQNITTNVSTNVTITELVATTSQGTFSLGTSNGTLTNFTVDEDLNIYFEVADLALFETINVSINLPFAIPEGTSLLLWKDLVNGTVTVPNSLDESRTVLTLTLQDGVIDDDGVANGVIVDPLQLMVPQLSAQVSGEGTNTIAATITDVNQTSNLTLSTPDGIFTTLSFIDKATTIDIPQAEFGYHLFSYELNLTPNTTSAQITVTYPEAIPANFEYYKFNPNTLEWFVLPSEQLDANTLRFTVVDGGLGDLDGAVNGVIVDPSGIGWIDDVTEYRQELTITYTGNTSNLTNYPIEVSLDNNTVNETFNWSIGNTSLRFAYYNITDDTQTNLSYWIKSYNETTETAEIWVNVTFIPGNETDVGFGNGTQIIYMYYGNPSATTESNATNVFELYLDFDNYTINAYNPGGQDGAGGDLTAFEIREGGRTLYLIGNAWKYIETPYNIIGDGSQMLELDFAGNPSVGEIYCISFEDIGGSVNEFSNFGYNFGGSDGSGQWCDYPGSGNAYSSEPSFEAISIVMNEFTSADGDIVFIGDDDSGNQTRIFYRDVRIRSYVPNEPTITFNTSSEFINLLNATMDQPVQFAEFNRFNAFEMNGTVQCLRGNCSNVTAYAQYLGTALPTFTITETTTADFASFNTSTNISAVDNGLQLDGATAPPWFLLSWVHRQPINFTNTAGNLTDYPVRINIDNSSVGADFNWTEDETASRFVFYNATSGESTQLDYFIDYWNVTEENASIFVSVPFLENNTETTIYYYYGNPSAIQAQNGEGVFETLVNFTESGVVDGGIAGGQDGQGGDPTASFILDDFTLQLTGNAWKYSTVTHNIVGDGSQVLEWLYKGNPTDTEILGLGSDDHTLAVGNYRNSCYHLGGSDGGGQWCDYVPDVNYSSEPNWQLVTAVLDDFASTGPDFIWIADDDDDALSNVTYRNVRIRKYASPEPSVASIQTQQNITFEPSGEYISDAFDLGSDSVNFFNISWSTTTNDNTSITFSTRSSSDNVSFTPWFSQLNNTVIQAPEDRYVQYRLIMNSSSTQQTPVLNSIEFSYQTVATDWTTMASSGTTFTTSNPFDCGLMGSVSNCTINLSILPREQGNFSLRWFVNSTDGEILNAISDFRNISVFLQPSISSFTFSEDVVATTESITITAQIVDEAASGLENYNLSFWDETANGTRQFIGSSLSDSSGFASVIYTPAADYTLGTHTINVSYPGDTSQFIRPVNATQTVTVSSRPVVDNVTETDIEIGYGYNLTVTADVFDLVGLDTVVINFTNSSGFTNTTVMTNNGGGNYSFFFNDSWKLDTYSYVVIANNTDGITTVSNIRNFEVTADMSFLYRTDQEGYANDKVVYTAPLSSLFPEWANRVSVDVSNSIAETDFQVRLPLDENTIDFSLADENGSDIRLSYLNSSGEEEELDYWIEFFNQSAQSGSIWIQLPTINATAQTVYIYFNNPSATDAQNGTGVFIFFDDFETTLNWTNYSSGQLTQSTLEAFSGSRSMEKDAVNDPNGGYIDIYANGSSVGRDIIFDFRLNRPAVGPGGTRNRPGLIDNSGNGYGYAVTAGGSSTLDVEERSSYGGTDLNSGVSVTGAFDTWIDGALEIRSDGTVKADRFINRVLDGTISASDSTVTAFTRVYIFGGWRYYVDDIRLRKYSAGSLTTNFGSVETVQSGLRADSAVDQRGFLRMITQEYNEGSGTWSNIVPPVVDQFFLNVSGLDAYDVMNIWNNSGGWNTTTRDPGLYRVYAVLEDPNRNLLVNDDGEVIEYGYNFTILESVLRVTNLTHEHEVDYGLNEYETQGQIDFINVTITALNNTALDANITLDLLDDSLSPVNFGPDNELQSCGSINLGDSCEREFDNSTNGYPIPATASAGTYDFFWNVTMETENGPTAYNASESIIIHHIPANTTGTLNNTRISKPNSTGYVVNLTNPWSGALSNINFSINCPVVSGFNCSNDNTGTFLESISTLGSGATATINFTLSANDSVPSDNYLINISLNYTNPAGEQIVWSEIAIATVEVRNVGILEITNLGSPLNVTRGSSYSFNSSSNNTGDTNATNAYLNYTLPSGWSVTAGSADLLFAQQNVGEVRYNNITALITTSAVLGGQTVRLDSGADDGRIDFITYVVDVYAPTTVVLGANQSFVDRLDNITITATLRYDNGTAIAGETVEFYDNTSSFAIGTVTTDGSGVASVSYFINSTQSLGLHTITATYNGSNSIYTRSVQNTTTIDVKERPDISSATVTPANIGYGRNVSVDAVVSDLDGMDTVLAEIVRPDGSATNVTMDFTPPFDYNTIINDTWDLGQYNITIIANDSLGSVSTASLSFTVSANFSIYLETLNDSYIINEDVNITSHPVGIDWLNADWQYKKEFVIENNNSDLEEFQVYIETNLTDEFAAGKVQEFCEDIRFGYAVDGIQEQEVYHSITYCNNSNNNELSAFWVKLPRVNASSNSTVAMYYGNNQTNTSSANETAVFSYDSAQLITYVISDVGVSSGITITAMFDDTDVYVNGTLYQLDELDQQVIASGLAEGNEINTTKPVSVEVANVNTQDMTLPISWAGTEFIQGGPRASPERWCLISPYGNASYSILDGGSASSSGTVGPEGTCFDDEIGGVARITSNASILVYKYGNDGGTTQDAISYYPATTEDLFVPSVSNQAYIAAGPAGATATCYGAQSGLDTASMAANAEDNCNGGTLNAGTQGLGEAIRVRSATLIGAQQQADSNGNDGSIGVPRREMSTHFAVAYGADYVKIVSPTPNSCTIRDSGGDVDHNTSVGDSTNGIHDICFNCNTEGSNDYSGPFIVNCTSPAWMYYDTQANDDERNVFGLAQNRRGSAVPVTVLSESSEFERGSLIINREYVSDAYLVMKVQRNVSNVWNDVETVVSSSLRTINKSHLDLASIWNVAPFNTGVNPSGDYRVYAELQYPNGTILVNDDDSQVIGFWPFSIVAGNVELNVTNISVYDITAASPANRRVYTNDFVGSGVNTTFTVDNASTYRFEVTVESIGSDNWELNSSNITYQFPNWNVNTSEIWYSNDSTTLLRRLDTTYEGGNYSGGNVTWNSSLGGVAVNGTSFTFFFIIEITSDTDAQIDFSIDSEEYTTDDLSSLKVLVVDTRPPQLFNSIYNITPKNVTRGDTFDIYARWDENINLANATYSTTSPVIFVTTQNLSASQPQNWTNFTIASGSTWYRGVHTAQITVADDNGNGNNTLPFLNFTVFGEASISAYNLNTTNIIVGESVDLTCTIVDTTNLNSPIANYYVTFTNETDTIATVQTNSSGVATFVYTDVSIGTENIGCTIAENVTEYYLVGTAAQNISLLTREIIPPTYSNIVGPSEANKGTTISLEVNWSDNFALEEATLEINISGNVSNQTITGTNNYTVFSYDVPTTITPGNISWRQYANDTFDNVNVTPSQIITIYGWSRVSSSQLSPTGMQQNDTTTMTCSIVDANQTSVGLDNYLVYFEYKNQSSSNYVALGTNNTNTSGQAVFSFSEGEIGLYDVRCYIEDQGLYNVSTFNTSVQTLNVVNGTDIWPPVIVGNNYTINDTSLLRNDCFAITGLWNESINFSYIEYNRTATNITQVNISAPYPDNYTNVSVCTNDTWELGFYNVKLVARDQAGNINTSLNLLNFTLQGRSSISYISPTGNLTRSSQTILCQVNDTDTGAPLNNYPVQIFDADLGFAIGTGNTNASGEFSTTYDYTGHPPGPDDISCSFASQPSIYYVAQAPLLNTETVTFRGNLTANITLPTNNQTVYRQELVTLNATVLDEAGVVPIDGTGATATLDDNWYNFSPSLLASEKNTTWLVNSTYPLGPQTIFFNVSEQYYSSANDTINITVFSRSRVNVSAPIHTVYRDAVIIQFVCDVQDIYSNRGVANYPVQAFRDSTPLSYNTTNSSGSVSFTDDTTPLGEGNYSYYCMIADNVSLYYTTNVTNSNSSINITVDKTPPQIDHGPLATLAGFYNNDSITAQVIANDSVSLNTVLLNDTGVLSTYTFISGGVYRTELTSLADGTYIIGGFANDSAGNINETILRTIVVDTIAPTLEIISPVNNSFTNISSFDIFYNASDVNRDSCFYSLNGAANQTIGGCANVTIPGLVNGTNNFTLYVNDSAGNSINQSLVINLDQRAPNATIFIPVQNFEYQQVNVPLNFSVFEDFSIDTCFYNLNGTSNITIPGCNNITLNGLVNANYTLTLFINDSAGNQNSSQVNFSVNFTELAVTPQSPLNNEVVTATSLTLNASTNLAAYACNYTLDAAAPVAMSTSNNFSWTAAVVGLSQGPHNVSYSCATPTNFSTSILVNFTVDTIGPNVTFVAPTLANNSATSDTFVLVNITTNEPAGTATIQWTNSSGSFNFSMTNATSTTDWFINVSALSDTTHTYIVFVTDIYGNLNQSEERTIIVSAGFPTIFIDSPMLGNTYLDSNIINLSVRASKPITEWIFELNGENFTFAPNTTIPAKMGRNNLTVYGTDIFDILGSANITFDYNGTVWQDNFATYAGLDTATSVEVGNNATIYSCWSELLGTSVPQENPEQCWPYRKQINVTSATATTDQVVKVNVNLTTEYGNGFVQTACEDLRFSYANTSGGAVGVIDHWVESCDSGNATVWIEMPDLDSNTVTYVYYGNNFTTDGSNGTNVFAVFDEFSAAPTVSDWGANAANWNSNGSVAFPTVGGATSQLISSYTAGSRSGTELWIRGNSSAGSSGYYTIGNGAGSKYIQLYLEPSNNRVSFYNGANNYYTMNSSLQQRYSLTTDFVGDSYDLFVNGSTTAAVSLGSAGAGGFTSPRFYSFFNRGLFVDRVAIYDLHSDTISQSSIGEEETPQSVNATMISIIIEPTVPAEWDVFSVVTDLPTQSNITFAIRNASGDDVCGLITATQAGSGYDICAAAQNYTSLQLFANLTTDGAAPSLINWSINWSLETVNPSVVITLPINGTQNDTGYNITIDATVTDLYGIDTVLANVSWLTNSQIVTLIQQGATDNYSGNFTNTSLAANYTITIIANDTNGNVNNTEFVIVELSGANLADLLVSDIIFDTLTPIEGELVNVTINVTNNGTVAASAFVVELNISYFNGSSILNISLNDTVSSLGIGASTLVEFNWSATIGTYIFSAFADALDNETEIDETNNEYNENLSVSVWQIYYGSLSYELALSDSAANLAYNWTVNVPEGNTYFADTDASYFPFNLQPLNGTNDLREADNALGILGLNDSIAALFDTDSNGNPDTTTTLNIAGVDVTEIPIINTTNTSAFITGLLWDSADGGSEYNGSQDLVIVTRINASQVGSYGSYDYEARVPSPLSRVTGGFDTITRVDELR